MPQFLRKLKANALGLVIVLLASSVMAQTPEPSAGQALAGLEAFDEAMQSLLQKTKFPGATLTVYFQDRQVLNKAYGFAKKGFTSNVPMAVDQRMRLASLSKWITATAALKAVDQGKLDLDKPYVEVMGFSSNPADYDDKRILGITTRQLLQNHAGWVLSFDPMFERSPPCPDRSERWLSTQKLSTEPGQIYSYSNTNFCLVTQLIEKVTKEKYVDFVKTQIAAAAGATSWEFATLSGKSDEPDYIFGAGDPYVHINFEALGGAGAWTSTTADYARFLVALRGYKGAPLLSPASMAQLTTRPKTAASANTPTYYGLGVNVRALEGGGFNLWHTGSLPGTSSFAFSFANGWTMVANFNSRIAQNEREKTSQDIQRALVDASRKAKPPATGDIATR
jgi:CubicO group peptidase (beta-lactamase class C family)